MSTTEDRIVRMKFDNTSFKKGAVETKASLDAIDASVAKAGKGRGLLDMAGHMETVKVKASAMQVATVTAIANIANRAVNAGISMAKSLTLDPIKAGFDEYELKMKSIQTILANTKGESLKTVSAALKELNEYSDKTIYNFANMTENIGKLTTAGITLEDATSVVKGFSNMVALAGGDANAAAGAMEQFGQGLQAGTIKAMDWMSISNRGLGSQSLQKAFFETARAFGPLKDVPIGTTFEEWTKANGGFKASLEQGWLTTEVATEALKVMTGDVKDVQDLVKMGFDPKTAQDMLDIADNALDSATKVRTFTAFLGTLKEQIGSGWSQIIELFIGDFNEATKMFTAWSDTSGRIIGAMFGYLEKLVKGWDKLGGRSAALKTIQNILSPIAATLGLIATLFGKAFPAKESGSGLATLSKALEHLTRPLNILGKLIKGQLTPLEALKRLMDVNAHAIRNLIRYVGDLLKPLLNLIGIKAPPTGGFFDFVQKIAEAAKNAVHDVGVLIKKGGSLKDVFSDFKADLPDFGGMFGGVDKDLSKIKGLASSVSAPGGVIGGGLSSLPKSNDGPMFNPDVSLDTSRIKDVSGDVADSVDDFINQSDEVETAGDKMGGVLSKLKGAFLGFFKGFSFDDLTASFNLAVLATFMISVSRFFNTLTNSFKGFVGTGEAVNGVLTSAGDALGSFQTSARAKLITSIAIAIGILAVSLWVLSKIPMEQMTTALFGMAGIMAIMKVGVDSITKAVSAMSGKNTAFNLTALSLALLALGGAILLLTVAFLLMNKVKWESLLKGLLTIRVVMITFERLGQLAEKSYKNILAGAFAIAIVAGSMVVLAGALLLFKLVDWESMKKAGVALLAIVGAIAVLGMINTEIIAKAGGSMLLASIGMLALANALIIFGKVEWESIKKAGVVLAGLVGAFILLSIFMKNPVAVTGFVALSVAMIGLATAALIMNKVDWSSIGKIGVILGALVLVFAAFIGILYLATPALVVLTPLAGGLALLALALTGLALAFAVIFPLLAAGAGAFAAFATGAAVAFAVFMTTLAAEAPILKKAFLDILQVLIDSIVEAVPMIMQGFEDLWTAIKKQFSNGGGGGKGMNTLMGDSGKSWMDKLKDSIKKKIPEITDKAIEVGKKFLGGLIKRAGEFSAKGAEFVTNLIKGIGSKIDGMTTAAVDLIVKFADSVGNNLPKMVTAGITLVSEFLHAIADGIRSGSGKIGKGITDIGDAFFDVGKDLVNGLIEGMKSLASKPKEWIEEIVGALPGWAKKMLGIASPSKVFMKIGVFLVDGLTKGIQDNASAAITAVASMVGGQIAVANEYVSKFVQDLDQKALAATAKAMGLQKAAQAAAKAAEKTKKNEKDDKSAEALQDKADRAVRKADRLAAKVDKAKEEQDRAEEFENATLLEKAQMRSEDAQSQMDAAKGAEMNAAAKLAEANALREQAKAKGVSKKDAKEMRKQADALEKQARRQALVANQQIELARKSAQNALELQQQAGAEAAALFQARFDAEAKEDADSEAFDKLTDAQKAEERRKQAAILQAKAEADLVKAKALAYEDLEAANDLADQANDQAEQARQYLLDAAEFERQAKAGTGTSAAETGGTVVNLDPTEAASIAFNRFADQYDAGVAAAAGDRTVEFNQYNTSPEALSPADVYRQTNNLLEFAADKVTPTAA